MAQAEHRPPPREPPPPPWLTAAEAALAGLAALWLVAGTVWALLAGAGLAALVLALVPPSAMAVAVALSRALRLLRAEGARLARAVAALGAARGAAGQGGAPSAPPPARPAAPPPAAPPPAAPALPEPPPAPPVPLPEPAPESEPQLGLAAPEAEPVLARADLVRALHFPEDEQDVEGFAALRRALGNRRARQLIQAAQDVLTLLSQDGIYMDDLLPDHVRPEIWRRFARGERGRPVAQLGGIHSREALGAVMGRMREDTIFRDTAHHFLRLFDRILADFEPEAGDEELVALSGTRTARAFMLIGRAAGVFG